MDVVFLLDKTAPCRHATSSNVSFWQSAGSRTLQLSAVLLRDALLIFFGLVPGSLKVFFPPHWSFFFPLHFTFRLLRRCCWFGPFGYHYSQFLSRLEALKPGFFQHWGFGFWLCMWGIFKCLIWIHLIWLRTKHIPNFLKAFGYIESSHQIVLMNSPLNGEHLPEICVSGYANPSKPLAANPP